MEKISFIDVAWIRYYCMNEATSEQEKREYIKRRLNCSKKEAAEISLGFDLFEKVRNRYFGHTDFFEVFSTIQKYIIEEIYDVVKANGDECLFGDKGPLVSINQDAGPTDVKVYKVYIEDDSLCVDAMINDEWGEWDDENISNIEIGDIFVEHLDFILDVMHNLGFIK